MRMYRSAWVAALAVAGAALVGGLVGGQVLAVQEEVPQHYSLFSEALSAIEANYVQPVETEPLIYGAIHGMLQTLDPHSSFMNPRDYPRMRERQEGRYYGPRLQLLLT